jgi:hypothetical protein
MRSWVFWICWTAGVLSASVSNFVVGMAETTV